MSFIDRIMANVTGGRDSKADLMTMRANEESFLNVLLEKVTGLIEEVNCQGAEIISGDVDVGSICSQGEHIVQSGIMQLQPCIVRLKQSKQFCVQLMVVHGRPQSPKSPNSALTAVQLAFTVVADASVSGLQMLTAGIFPTVAASLIPVITYAGCTTLGAYAVGYLHGRRIFGLNTSEPGLPEFKSVRRIALFITASLIVTVGWAHLELALMRTQFSLSEIDHSVHAYWQLVSVPEAFFMLLVGALTGIFAYFKGIKHSPYPVIDDEAGAAIEGANDDLDNAKEEALRSVADHFDDALEAINNLSKKEAKGIKRYRTLLNKCRQAHGALLNAISTSERKMKRTAARVEQIHAAPARGRPRAVQDNSEVSDFSSFKEGLTLPQERTVTNYSSIKTALKTAKLSALTKLETYISKEVSSIAENTYE